MLNCWIALEQPFIISSAENLRQVREKFAGGMILIISFRDFRGFINKFIQLNAMAIFHDWSAVFIGGQYLYKGGINLISKEQYYGNESF